MKKEMTAETEDDAIALILGASIYEVIHCPPGLSV